MKKTNSNFSFILCLVVAGILLYWISLPVFGVVSPQERAALIALYNNTNGDDWSSTYGWKKPPLDLDGFAMPGTEKNWYGIKCDPDNTTVQRIDLYNNNLNGALPPELGNLANLTYLGLNNNQLSGNIPPELGNLANLHDLELFSNQLSGSIPPELGNLANLHNFDLGYNKLTGSIPSTFTNLTKLVNDWSDLTYNALYTNNDTLRVFLHSKQISGDWQGAQTVAPTNLSATPISSTSIDIHWTPIIYKGNSGGYRVFYSNIPGGPYTYFGITADKTASSLPVTELNPDTTYYFVVQTRTDPNYANRNTVDSEYSGEVSGVTCHLVTISGKVTAGGRGLQGVTITLSNNGGIKTTGYNGYYCASVPYGWSGTATPSKRGYCFFPVKRSYCNLKANQTSQNYTTSQQTRTISGTVTFGSSKLPGVTITLDNNGGSATTDANGNYSVTVNYGWSGTATPSYPGYDFTPANRSYTNVTADQTNQDYIVSVIIILTLTSPNGGETWPITSLRNITWKAAGISDNLEITLWKGGVLIGIIADDINPAVGFYAWTVGQLIDGSMVSCGSDYTIKIKETGQSPEDSSDANFNISPGITVDAPNGGETLKFGDLLQITWRTGCLSHNIKITLWTDSGWEGLIKYNINPADGSFLWTVGDVFDSTGKAKLPVDINLKYKIKIKEISTVVSDYSDNYITLIK
ncbi:MAG: hypothetical protein QG657_2800 [Acidobacteriota bacterium]|nr:hypothetical protein [Acidobacteriota bacterium]